MPLERFADSNAIQLINQHASVPPPPAKAEPAAGEPATAQQSLPSTGSARATVPVDAAPSPFDPWSPRR
jgi:hypothetical protein